MLLLCLAQQCLEEACPVLFSVAPLFHSHEAVPQAAADFSLVGGVKTTKLLESFRARPLEGRPPKTGS